MCLQLSSFRDEQSQFLLNLLPGTIPGVLMEKQLSSGGEGLFTPKQTQSVSDCSVISPKLIPQYVKATFTTHLLWLAENSASTQYVHKKHMWRLQNVFNVKQNIFIFNHR